MGVFYFGAKFNCSRWLVCVDNKAFSFLVESKSHCLQNDGCVFSFFFSQFEILETMDLHLC